MNFKKCCNKPGKYKIIYDWQVPEELILCEYHYNLDPAFSDVQFIKKIEELKE